MSIESWSRMGYLMPSPEWPEVFRYGGSLSRIRFLYQFAHDFVHQNYLVYTNSLLFIRSGGNSRIAGIMLALGTCGLLVIGPTIIGYIPIMVVGALIFVLGIELMREALYDTWGRVHRLEYATVRIGSFR